MFIIIFYLIFTVISSFFFCLVILLFSFHLITGKICADDPSTAVLVGVVKRRTEFTPLADLAKNTDFR